MERKVISLNQKSIIASMLNTSTIVGLDLQSPITIKDEDLKPEVKATNGFILCDRIVNINRQPELISLNTPYKDGADILSMIREDKMERIVNSVKQAIDNMPTIQKAGPDDNYTLFYPENGETFEHYILYEDFEKWKQGNYPLTQMAEDYKSERMVDDAETQAAAFNDLNWYVKQGGQNNNKLDVSSTSLSYITLHDDKAWQDNAVKMLNEYISSLHAGKVSENNLKGIVADLYIEHASINAGDDIPKEITKLYDILPGTDNGFKLRNGLYAASICYDSKEDERLTRAITEKDMNALLSGEISKSELKDKYFPEFTEKWVEITRELLVKKLTDPKPIEFDAEEMRVLRTADIYHGLWNCVKEAYNSLDACKLQNSTNIIKGYSPSDMLELVINGDSDGGQEKAKRAYEAVIDRANTPSKAFTKEQMEAVDSYINLCDIETYRESFVKELKMYAMESPEITRPDSWRKDVANEIDEIAAGHPREAQELSKGKGL